MFLECAWNRRVLPLCWPRDGAWQRRLQQFAVGDCCGARPMEGGRRYSLEAMSTGGFGAAGLVARGRSGTAAEARDAMEAGMCKDGLAGPEAECGR